MASISRIKWPKVILFGDSLTESSCSEQGCWGNILANNFKRKCDIIVRGFRGYNSKICKAMLPYLFDHDFVKDTVALTLLLGSNDSVDCNVEPFLHVSLLEYENNLCDIIDFFNEIGVSWEKIILITPPPVDGQRFLEAEGGVLHRGNELLNPYVEACRRIASKYPVELIDLNQVMVDKGDWGQFFYDGLHFNPKGGAVLADLLAVSIAKRIPFTTELFPTREELCSADPVELIRVSVEKHLKCVKEFKPK